MAARHAVPIAASALAELVTRAALDARPGVQAGGGHAVRVGVDGPIPADTAGLADAVAAALADLAVPVARVRAADFLRARSLRLEYGRHDPDGFYQGWYDTYGLQREVLDPLGPGGSGRWLPRLRDPATDRPFRDAAVPAAAGTVAVVDGPFLGRWELSGALDLLVHLEVSPAAIGRRLPADPGPADGTPGAVAQAWQDYLDACSPCDRADLVVRFDHPDRPALVNR